ncbi:MAG: hypothetical protein K8U57_27820 [Planctomycetes bacterium]|nr:hypothetical protein [Planctomycetota bacterium]
MSVTLTLGGVVFADFEIPPTINFGGAQMLVIHKLPGGSRVIDSLGPDDADIRWSGRFRGSSAEQRALLLDFMRRQGRQILLTWGLHRYQVVIREFTANFEQTHEIPYSITCAVVKDEAQAIASAVFGFVESLAADLVSAAGLSAVIGSATISAAVTGVGTALSNYQAGVPNTTNALAGATAAAEGPLLSALQNSITGAQTVTRTAIASASGAVTALPTPAGGSPSAMASALTATTAAVGQLGNLYQLSSVLGRMGVNTTNKGS